MMKLFVAILSVMLNLNLENLSSRKIIEMLLMNENVMLKIERKNFGTWDILTLEKFTDAGISTQFQSHELISFLNYLVVDISI